MRDVDALLGETVAALVRAGRVLHPEWLAVLLEYVSDETEAALLEHDARTRGARRRSCASGSVIAFPGMAPGDAPPREPTDGKA